MNLFYKVAAFAAIAMLFVASGCRSFDSAQGSSTPERMEVTGKRPGLWSEQVCQQPPSVEEIKAFEKFAASNGEMPVMRAISALAGMAGMRVEFDPALRTGKEFLVGTNTVMSPPAVNVTVNLPDLAGLGVRQALFAIADAYDLRIYQLLPSDKWQVTYEYSRSPEKWREVHGGWMQLRRQTRH